MNRTSVFSGGTLQAWREVYAASALSPKWLADWVADFDAADPMWISLATRAQIESQADALEARLHACGGDRTALPLWGIPFAVKDNLDVAGFSTSAACPKFAYPATEDAAVVALLRAAGAIVVGKTNLDQFATGLVGTRSPYGIVPSSLDATRIGGGSSSGSAAAVARGLVPFALGTDTAGSGRVPAAFQNIVGYKPTKGRFSTRGVVPACKTLDCVSIFALTVRDADAVAQIVDRYDERDVYARRAPTPLASSAQPVRRLGLPGPLEFFGDELARRAFEQSIEIVRGLGVELVPVDFAPFRELASLLYSESWVVERALVAESLLQREPEAIHPVVRGILEGAAKFSAAQAFVAEYRRAELARAIDVILSGVDALIVPTTPTCYRIQEVLNDPLGTNTRLGTYTNFTNLADLSGVAIPGVFRADGFPAGITLLGRAFEEVRLVELATRVERRLNLPLGALGRELCAFEAAQPEAPLPAAACETVRLAVVGAHLRGMPLCHQLTDRGAQFVTEARTAARYRLQLIPGTQPQKPGLSRVADGEGTPIELELWDFPLAAVGDFLNLIPSPLGLGTIELQDGAWVKGFICEPWGLEGAEDISHHGGFRAWRQSRLGT